GRANFYNNLGELVLSEVIDDGEIKIKIPVTVLNSGVYFVHISANNESIVKKIVISH
ncbi:MAG: T9SS type A sorting domain-containing protein, partial [Bacteroidia bacterium]